ncbi:MAG: TIGR02391 family protein [Candidatus Bathyarchaeia archaeon]|jgi:uncharacterized protein (TIGR02391 family)
MSKITLEDFKKNWEGQITKIEQQALNSDTYSSIILQFRIEKGAFRSGLNENELTHDDYLELEMLEGKLRAALGAANSRYELADKGKLSNNFQSKKMINWFSGEHKKEDLAEETKKALVLFDEIITHPKINEVSSVHFKNGNYRSAVLDAAIKLEVMVKEKAKYPQDNRGRELSGVALMHTVFDVNKPILSWCKNEMQIEKDELEGYKFIFAGTVQGIRDPKAYAIFEISPMRALKLLTLITLLAELVDASEYQAQSQVPSPRTKTVDSLTPAPKNAVFELTIKQRIEEDLICLREQIGFDLAGESYHSRAFPIDVYMALKNDILLEVDNEVFRKIQETYMVINELRLPLHDREMSEQKYEHAIACIDESLQLLK